eukprot:COSAG02_NODE_301_length_25237_cov_19.918490_7_plen_91_part_00
MHILNRHDSSQNPGQTHAEIEKIAAQNSSLHSRYLGLSVPALCVGEHILVLEGRKHVRRPRNHIVVARAGGARETTTRARPATGGARMFA